MKNEDRVTGLAGITEAQIFDQRELHNNAKKHAVFKPQIVIPACER